MQRWTWDWHPHPDAWALVLVLLVAYHLLLRAGSNEGRDATRGQRLSFHAGLLVLLAVTEWPVHDLAEGFLYSVHMVQHLALSLVVPPLLLAGIPAWMVRAVIPPKAMRVLRRITRPFIALVIFNVTIVVTHWPLLVNEAVGNEPLHFGLHALLVGSAFIMWMPVLSPVMELPRISLPGQMMYLFLQSLVPTVPASFLTFGERPLYAAYEAFVHPWGVSSLTDQRTAGLIMKIAGGLVLWGFITAIFFRWSKQERTEGVDLLQMQDVDRSLSRMELVDR